MIKSIWDENKFTSRALTAKERLFILHCQGKNGGLLLPLTHIIVLANDGILVLTALMRLAA